MTSPRTMRLVLGCVLVQSLLAAAMPLQVQEETGARDTSDSSLPLADRLNHGAPAAEYAPLDQNSCPFGTSPTLPLRFLNYSYAAYCGVSALQSWTCKWCTDNSVADVVLVTNSDTAMQAFVAHSARDNSIVVSFRGTHNLKNWIEDLKLAKTTSAFKHIPGATELGFSQVYQSVRASTLTAVERALSKTGARTVWITGHSLGAAVATLLAYDLAYSKGADLPWPVTLHTVTFGCPRVGDAVFAAAGVPTACNSGTCLGTICRYTNKHDIVPHLPPKILGFHHTPQEVWIRSGDADLVRCSGSNGEDKSCSDGQIDLSVSDHLDYFGWEESC